MAIEVTLEDAEWMVGLAGLSGVDSVERLAGGWDNYNLRLELSDGTRLVLKLWQAQSSIEDVESVIQRHIGLAHQFVAVLAVFRSKGIPHTKPDKNLMSFNIKRHPCQFNQSATKPFNILALANTG